MDDINPTVKPTETTDGNPEVPNNDDHSGGTGDERLDLPIVPTQDDLTDPPTIDSPAAIDFSNDAPYGRNKDGTPAKKRGRKKVGETQGDLYDRLDSVTPARPLPPGKSAEKPAGQVIPTARAVVTDYRAMGMLAASLWIKGGAVAFGPDWAPNMDDPLEKEQPKELADAFTGYFKAKEIEALSPEWALAFVLFSYTVTKVQKPTVSSRFGRMIQWIKSKAKR